MVLYSGIKMKNGPPGKCVCIKIMVHIIIMRGKQYILSGSKVHKQTSFAENNTLYMSELPQLHVNFSHDRM